MRVTKVLILPFLAIMCLVMVQTAYAADRPLNIWLFEEGSGTSAQCLPDNINQGQLMGGAAWSAGTPLAGSNWSVSLDGINDYVSTPLSTPTNDDAWRQLSAGAWIYIDQIENSTTTQVIASNGWVKGFDWYLYGNQLGVNITGLTFFADTTIDVNTWTHVAFTSDKDQMGDNIRMYINGEPAGQGRRLIASIRSNLGAILYLGRSLQSGGGYLDGKIDEVKIYHGVFTPVQIKFDYESGLAATYDPKSVPASTRNPGATVEWNSEWGYKYQVEWSPDNTNWSPRSEVLVGTGETMEWCDTTVRKFNQPGQNYYRVMQLTDIY